MIATSEIRTSCIVLEKDCDKACLLYTSDAADDLLCVDLGGRRIIKKKLISLIRNDYELH